MFIKEPEPFASFRGELVFEYEQEEQADLTFEIELDGEDESQEVKKLYGVSSATINIAHVVANKVMTTPSSGESSLETPQNGFGLVRMKCGEEQSSARYFVASEVELPEVGVISSMPKSRTISYGEAEEIWICAEQGDTVEVRVESTSESGKISATFCHTTEECGLTRFRFATEDFGAYAKFAKVEIEVNGESIAQVEYCYVPKVKGAVRVAWIGRYGGVEHYTFPVTNSLVRYKSGVRRYEVESMYEPRESVVALAEVLRSQGVWIVEDGVYLPVQMVSDEVELESRGALSTVSYKIERYD